MLTKITACLCIALALGVASAARAGIDPALAQQQAYATTNCHTPGADLISCATSECGTRRCCTVLSPFAQNSVGPTFPMPCRLIMTGVEPLQRSVHG
jgi:hypothetical protein